MATEHDPSIWHAVADWTKEIVAGLASIFAGLLGWIGWLYRRYTQDRGLLTSLGDEQAEYRRRFGADLLEKTSDVDATITALAKRQDKCDRIHDGMADGDTGPKLVAKLTRRIESVDARLTQHIVEEAEIRRRIENKLDRYDQKLDKIIEKLS